MRSPGQALPTSAAGRLVRYWRSGNLRRESRTLRGPQTLPSVPPPSAPSGGGASGRVLLALQQSPPPRPAPLAPDSVWCPHPAIRRTRVTQGPPLAGTHRPRPAVSTPHPTPPEGGGDSTALPRPSRRRPQQAPCPLRPAAAGRTSGARGSPAEVSEGGSAGGGKPLCPGNSLQTANLPREGRG